MLPCNYPPFKQRHPSPKEGLRVPVKDRTGSFADRAMKIAVHHGTMGIPDPCNRFMHAAVEPCSRQGGEHEQGEENGCR